MIVQIDIELNDKEKEFLKNFKNSGFFYSTDLNTKIISKFINLGIFIRVTKNDNNFSLVELSKIGYIIKNAILNDIIES